MQHVKIRLGLQLFLDVTVPNYCAIFTCITRHDLKVGSLFIISETANAFGIDIINKSVNICKYKSITLYFLIFVLGYISSSCYKINSNYGFTCNKVCKENSEINCTTSV